MPTKQEYEIAQILGYSRDDQTWSWNLIDRLRLLRAREGERRFFEEVRKLNGK